MRNDNEQPIPGVPPPPTSRRASWLRYNWPKIFIHLLLIVLGVINIYPFFWMLGTSLKAEAEASGNRLRPVPERKYKLADGFSLDGILPTALMPEFDQADENGSDPLPVLRRKLQVLQRLQRTGWTSSVRPQVVSWYVEEDEGFQEQKQTVDDLQTRIEELTEELELEAEMGTLDDEAQAARKKHIKSLESDLAKEQEALEEIEEKLEEAGEKLFAEMIEAGVLVEDAPNRSTWPSKDVWAGRTDHLKPMHALIAEKLREYYTITLEDYANITGQEFPESREQLQELTSSAGAVLRPLPRPDEEDIDEQDRRYGLSPGARGRIYRDLYPRQILTMWSMHDENIRREESRATFPTDRWSAGEYRKNYGLADVAWADEELSSLREAGLLADGTFQWMNYWVVLREEHFFLHFFTSLVITAAVVTLTVIMTSMLGYALARIRFPGKMVVLGVMITAAVLPGEARIIPIFQMLMAVRALENLWGMVLWLTSFGVGNSLLMAAFFLTLPRDVDEAAEVDGAGTWRKFFDVALPMARPIMVTVGLFAFLTAWNNFLVPLVCTISRPSMQPLAVAVYNFQQGRAGKWQEINAAASLMIVPVIIMFLLVQRHVVRAIAVGAVKG